MGYARGAGRGLFVTLGMREATGLLTTRYRYREPKLMWKVFRDRVGGASASGVPLQLPDLCI